MIATHGLHNCEKAVVISDMVFHYRSEHPKLEAPYLPIRSSMVNSNVFKIRHAPVRTTSVLFNIR